jgi:hypothetical protein
MIDAALPAPTQPALATSTADRVNWRQWIRWEFWRRDAIRTLIWITPPPLPGIPKS